MTMILHCPVFDETIRAAEDINWMVGHAGHFRPLKARIERNRAHAAG